MAGGRPPIFDSPEAMELAIEDYFNPVVIKETSENTKNGPITTKTEQGREPRDKVTISGLCYHLGFESRQSFYDYEEREEFSYIVKRARLRVEMSYEQRLQDNACTGSIFALKNMGWADEKKLTGNLGITLIEGETDEHDEPIKN
jgi:hypothetical protein